MSDYIDKMYEDSDKENIQTLHDEKGDPYYVQLKGDKIKIMSGLGDDITIGIVGAIELADIITSMAEEALELKDVEDDEDYEEIEEFEENTEGPHADYDDDFGYDED